MPPTPKLRPGYAFAYEGDLVWRNAPNDEWETMMIDGDDISLCSYVGGRLIDGTHCLVFVHKGPGPAYFAQTAAMAGG